MVAKYPKNLFKTERERQPLTSNYPGRERYPGCERQPLYEVRSKENETLIQSKNTTSK
jgi:hypothetical protein